MVNSNDLSAQFQDIPAPSVGVVSAAKIQSGRLIPAQQQVLLYSPDEWEEFILEWVHSLRKIYAHVFRFAGANDMGIDIAGLTDGNGTQGVWDNFQCKHYDASLTPSTASAEIAKILWHSFGGHYIAPRSYYFVAPHGCGTGLTKLLADTSALKKYVIDNWDKQCSKAVTSTQVIQLNGDFEKYVQGFDFSIFKQRSLLEITDDHRNTPYYSPRFGGGLPDRPKPDAPPSEPDEKESRYVRHLFDAYGDHVKSPVPDLSALGSRPELVDHFHRQRESFYHAEALRSFARDTVPPGTFEDLQTEVHIGVVDIEASQHPDGYARVNAVTHAASCLQLTSNALISVVKIQDRKGICHQLANEDRLQWRKP